LRNQCQRQCLDVVSPLAKERMVSTGPRIKAAASMR
jgi:hypothetical protein